MTTRGVLATSLVLMLLSGGTGWAQRITLTVKEATLAEVAAQLRAQSGYEIQYIEPQEGSIGTRRRSFTWSNVPLKEAIRQVGTAYGYTFQRNSPTSFWGQPGIAPAEGRRPGVTIPLEAPNGGAGKASGRALQLYVDRLAISEMRTLQFGSGQAAANQSFSLELVAEGATEEAVDAIYGFDTGVEAMDDLGNRLVSEVRSFNTGPGSRFPNPDQWRQYLSLPAPSLRAKRLTYLTGELVLYRQVKSVPLEIPLPLPQRPFTREAGGVQVTVTDAAAQGGDFVVRATLTWQAGGAGTGPAGSGGIEEQRQIRPLLITAAGRRLRASNVTMEPARATGSTPSSEQQLRFAGMNEPAAKLIYEIVVKTQPDRRVRYRITDIPLPPPATAVPTKLPRGPQPAGRRPPRAAAAPEAVEVPEDTTGIPFYEASGGTLVLRLKGVPQSTRLTLGLSRREGGEWSGWRWADVARASDGSARLGPLRPGAYRVRYTLSRPNGAAARELAGAAGADWQAGEERFGAQRQRRGPGPGVARSARPAEIPVQVVAGREVTVR